jgi:catechol-2,3-dioxygenase
MADQTYDRTTEDLGNIINLGHVNVTVPDQAQATAYYMTGLGLTRDPFLMTGTNNMWANVGMSQFHLPTSEPQVIQGIIGLVIPNREALLARLAGVRDELADTQFDFKETNDAVETTCPWGNAIHCHAPDEALFGRMKLGMAYVEFDVPIGAAAGIDRFYREIYGGASSIIEHKGASCARVQAGEKQYLYFRETEEPRVPYDGNHIQVYINDFSGPYNRLMERGLITQESNQHQFRFTDIVDLDNSDVIYVIDHEVRSMGHPLYARPLINRNPAISLRAYDPGRERVHWASE